MKFQSTSINSIEYNYGLRSAAIGYFDNNTQLDLVVANSAADNMGIFLGYGNGSFSSLIMYSTAYDSIPHMATIGDFNNDHHLDIAVASFGTNSIGIFHGSGNGTLQTKWRFQRIRLVHFGSIQVISTMIQYLRLSPLTGTDGISIFHGYGNGTFSRSIYIRRAMILYHLQLSLEISTSTTTWIL